MSKIFNKQNAIKLVIYTGVTFAAMAVTRNCVDTKQELDIADHNLEVEVLYSTQFYKNKLDLMVAERKTFIATNRTKDSKIFDLSKENKELARKYKVVNAKLDAERAFVKPLMVSVATEADNVLCTGSGKFSDYNTSFSWKYAESQLSVYDFKSTEKLSLVIGAKKTGFFKTEQRVSLTSTNKDMHTKDLKSVLLSNKVKRWGLGASFGYDVINMRTSLLVGISYDFYQF